MSILGGLGQSSGLRGGLACKGGSCFLRGDLVYALVKNGLITFGSKFSLLYIMVNIFRFNKIETPRSLLN